MAILKTYLVEDSPVIRDSLVATLEELVPLHVVGTAGEESVAVQWLREAANECDLVIVDIFLRHGSGLNVLKQTCSEAGAAQRKHVVLSNYATPDMRNRCLELGADRVFDKSQEIDGLIDYCRNLSRKLTGSAHS